MVVLKLNSGLIFLCCLSSSLAIFVKEKWLENIRTNQKNYGVAVSDVNHDGRPDFIVAGYNGPNFVLMYDINTGNVTNIAREDLAAFSALRDVPGNAIGVTACDIDGDGKEEIYFLNTNQAYAGKAAYGDKIFKWRNGRYIDLYSDAVNANLPAKSFAGRSVACLDRKGTGKYAIAVATYSYRGEGKFALIEMDETHPENDVSQGKIVLRNVAAEAGIDKSTGGRGVAVGPILGNNGRSDIFFGNEGNSGFLNAGANFLFANDGNGRFTDVAANANVQDANENVRGIALADFNRDGWLDIAFGNWDGPHRLFLQRRGMGMTFDNVASSAYEHPSHIRTVIAADFDNDGNMEVFQNNIYHPGHSQPNKLFKVMPTGTDVQIQEMLIGDAREPEGYGTGAAVTDFNGDGKLELLISHGERNAQPLSIFTVSTGSGNNWIRVQPKTKYGAPARGASVNVKTLSGKSQLHVIDGGSGYLCEMEPYAHIGFGQDTPVELSVQWPDGTTVTKALTASDVNKVHVIEYKGQSSGGNENTPYTDCPASSWRAKKYEGIPVLCEGDRVTRGPEWNWGNEDNGNKGTVIRPAASSYARYMAGRGDPFWVMVRWDHGLPLAYRMGSRGRQDLCKCSDCGRVEGCLQCSC